MLHHSFVKQVNRSPARRESVRHVLRIRILHITSLDGVGRDRGFDRRAKHPRVQCPADREHGVTQNLGLDPLRTPPPQQAVVWIRCSGVSGERGRLTFIQRITWSLGNGGALPRRRYGAVLEIDRAGHDEPV